MEAAFQEMRSIYGVAMLALLSVFGITMIALALSWNVFDFELHQWTIAFLQKSTVVFHFSFAVVVFFVWDARRLVALVDATVCIVSPFADWYWYMHYKSTGELNPADVARYCLLIGYMTARFWATTVWPRHRSWKRASVKDGTFTLERLELVWICRSSALVSKILPIMDESWSRLVGFWGDISVCQISIYVTDKDESANRELLEKIQGLGLSQAGAIHFCRPDLSEILQNHTLRLIDTGRGSSSSVLAFCGSSALSRKLHQDKISNDILAAITGNKKHQMEFVSESYGGTKPAAVKTPSNDRAPPQKQSIRAPDSESSNVLDFTESDSENEASMEVWDA